MISPPSGERSRGVTVCLAALLLLAVAVQEGASRLAFFPSSLAHDLPRLGVVLATGALAWPVLARRRPGLARRGLALGERAWSARGWWRAGMLLAGVLSLGPLVPWPFAPGLTLRLARPGEPAIESRMGSGLSVRNVPATTGEPFAATVGGWLYAPDDGRYDLRVTASGRALLRIDGSPVAGVAQGSEPLGPLGSVALTRGYHRVDLEYGHVSGRPRLAVRWALPPTTSLHRVPTRYLLPDAASAAARRLRAILLEGQRVGAAALVLLTAAGIGACLSATAWGARLLRGDRLGGSIQRGVLLLLFFLLTGTPILFGPERLAFLRPALGVLLVAVGLLAVPLWGAPRGVPAARRGRVAGEARTALALVPLLAVQALLVARFLHAVDGRLVFSDDHGSFLYRYHMLAQTFPRLVNYDPWWNAGVVDDSAVGGGAASVFLLTWPITRLLSLEGAYAWFVPVVAILAASWSLFAAIRLLGLSRGAALVGGLLALAPEEHGFVWLLERGTLPAMLAAALVPLAFALAWRVLVLGDRRWATIVGLAVVANLGSFWMLFPLMVAPGLLAAALAGRVKRRGLTVAAAVGTAIVLVNAGWILDFLRTREVGRLVQAASSSGLADAAIWERLVDVIPTTENPVGLVLGVAGLCLLPRPLRMPYAAMLAALALAAAIGPQLFPHLELLRLVIPLGFALIPPAAQLVAGAIRAGCSGRGGALGTLLAVALLLVMGVHLAEVWARYGNQTHRRAGFMPPATRQLIHWLRTQTAPEGRILFAGRVVHQYGGHIAYLQPLTGRPMYAASYYHGDWGNGTLPTAVLADADALRRRLELLNARYVVADATDAAWWRHLPRHPSLRLRAELTDIAVYETDIRPTYLIGARGTVAFDYNRLLVQLDAPADSVTLKFRWVDGLAATPPLQIRPREVAPGLSFIEAEPRGATRFEIRYRD